MTQAIQTPREPRDSAQGRRVIVAIRFTQYPQPKITPIATDANGSIMAEAVPTLANGLRGFLVRLRAQGCAIPRFRDSESLYPSLMAAEDAYWRQCEAEQFREDDVIEWGPWREAVVLVEA